MTRDQRTPKEGPSRRAQIAREGDVIARGRGRLYEGGPMLSQDEGSGIHHDEVAGTWTCTVPGFGYVELADSGEIRIVPAVKVREGRLRADLQLRATHSSESPLSRADVEAAIRSTGIVHGVMRDRIDEAWNAYVERGSSGGSVCIAEGTPPGPGWDAGIDLTVDPDEAFSVDEDEPVDYRDLRLISNVKKGQSIGFWRPASFGAPGIGVDGSALQSIMGRAREFDEMQNVSWVDVGDGVLELTSDIDGILQVLSHARVRVVKLLEIEEDVDFETGNIHANGSVRVGGSVRRDFKLWLQGDLIVKNDVEEAVIRAGGKVIVEHGIFGGRNGHVSAGGRIFMQFGQNAHLVSGTNIVVGDSDTRSVMECAGRISAKDGRGHLQGGRYSAGKDVMVRELGSTLGVPTFVSVGRVPRAVRRLRNELEAEGLPVDDLVVEDRPDRITVLGTVHPGVEIEIRGAHLRVEHAAHNVKFEFDVKTRSVKMSPRR